MDRRDFLRSAALASLGAASGRLSASGMSAAERPGTPFRVGFERSLFTDVNEGDARAAVMVWAQTVAQERGINVDPSAQLFEGTREIVDALRRETVDAVSACFPEYRVIAEEIQTGPWFLTQTSGTLLEEYVLLVHEEGGFDSPAALRGRSLALHASARMSLARDWLDHLAIGAGERGGAESLFGEIRDSAKVSGAVLPVFFRGVDGGVAADSGFKTLCELNPQLARKLRILARSRPLAPALMFLRRSYDSPEKERIIAALNELHRTPAGLQVLTLFQSEALVQVDERPLRETEAFLAEVRAQRAGSAGEGAAPPTPARKGVPTP